MIDYATILTRRFAGNEWTLNGDDYEGLIWISDTQKPSKGQLDALWADVQQEIADEAAERVRDREAALAKLRAIGLTDSEIAALGIR